RSASIRLTTLAGRADLVFGCRQTGLLGPDQLNHRVLVAVLEILRFKVASHLVDDGFGETHHLLGQLEIGYLLEYSLLGADFVGINEQRSHDALAERLQHHHALSSRHHDAPDTDHLLLHGIADHRERFLTTLSSGAR